MDQNVLVIAVASVLLGMFKAELGKIFRALGVYLRREFIPGDAVLVQCGATGEWGAFTIVKYRFSLSAALRGVYIRHADTGIERIPLIVWADFRKRPAVKEK